MEYRDNEIDCRFSFEEFVRMPSNALAYSAARSISDGETENSPLCLYSDTGCGKTHLLNAIANRYRALHPGKSIVLTSAARMIENYIFALQEEKMAEFRQHYRSADILLVDDIEIIEKTKCFEDELVITLNDLASLRRPMVFASEKCPMKLEVSKRTKSRIAGGLLAEIGSFTSADRVDVLKHLLKNAGIAIDDEDVALIASSVQGNAFDLIRVVKAVRLEAMAIEVHANSDMVRSALVTCGLLSI